MWSNHGYAEQSLPAVQHNALLPAPLLAAPPVGRNSASDGAFDVPPTLAERIELCKFMADAELLPRALQKKPANLLLIMHKALALNVPLGVAIDHFYVIDGKVDNSAELLRILIHRAGHVLRWPEISDKLATGELTLQHDPRNPRTFTFTIAQAQAMGLTGKDNWKKDAASMLVARCTTRLVTYHCPEIAGGMGNLSALDFEDRHPPEAAIQATATTEASLERQAADLYAEAEKITTSQAMKDIGVRARDAGLLEVRLDSGETLQSALLNRLNGIARVHQAAAERATGVKRSPTKTADVDGGEDGQAET